MRVLRDVIAISNFIYIRNSELNSVQTESSANSSDLYKVSSEFLCVGSVGIH